MCADSKEKYAQLPLERAPLGAYLLVLSCFMLGMAVLWALGVESAYGHPAPFYALFYPAASSWAVPATALLLWAAFIAAGGVLLAGRGGTLQSEGVRLAALTALAAGICGCLAWQSGDIHVPLDELQWHVLAVAVGGGGLLAAAYALKQSRCFSDNPGDFRVAYFLFGLFVFSIAFACTIAMLRGGLAGIAAPYTRVQYEYIGDIGVTSGIRELFRRYNEISEYLTMHTRAAPPGPLAILWGFSYLVGRDPLALALCTVVWGSAAVVPFHFWVREMASQRVAVVASLLYVFCPGIVLFTATSAEILFMPFTLATLFCFERAIRRGNPGFALAAGVGFGAMAHLKFPLVSVGVYFAVVGLRYMAQPEKRLHVVQTAAIMLAAMLAVIGGVWLWSGFDIITCFWQAKHHFDMDQVIGDQIAPRYPGWVYRFLNPWAWFFFAGIPVSTLFCAALLRKHRYSAECLVLFLALIGLNLLCLARGEAERSSLYVFPFILPPAAMLLERFSARAQSPAPLFTALAFMAVQCWGIETVLYTYW